MAAPILPTATELTTPMIDAIVAAWPQALQYFNSGTGNWNSITAIARGQFNLALVRLADEVNSARLRTAKGATLASFCASEFDTRLPSNPQTAVGSCNLQRSGLGPVPQGIIRKGTLFVKAADPNAQPLPIAAASYTTSNTVFVPQGEVFAQVNLVASTPGAAANAPRIIGVSPTIAPAAPLFDTTFTVQVAESAGGSSGLTDPVLVAAAIANAVGQYGPTDGAIIAGMLSTQAVRHYAYFPSSAQLTYAQAFAADESWSSGDNWTSTIAQEIATNWLGFGCRVIFGVIINQVVQVSPAIMLKSTDDLNNTDEIDDNVRAAISAYFDRATNWWLYRNQGLVAAIGAADPRILKCTSAAVIDQLSGDPVPDTVNSFNSSYIGQLVHYMSANDAVTSTYSPPT